MKRSPLGDLLRLYRVRDWVHFLPLPLAGWFASSEGDLRSLVGGVLGWGFGLAYASAINQAFDDRLDRANFGKNPVGASLARRQAVLLSVPPAMLSLAAVIWLSPFGVLPALLLILTATVYSAPPRLKRIPVLGTVWNVVIGIQGLFFAGRPDFSQGSLRVLVGLFAMLLLVAQLIHEAEDRDDDRAGGITTVGTLTGMQGALGAASLFLLLLPPATWWLADGVRMRALLTVLAALFAAAWAAALTTRVVRNHTDGLRAMRLRYRYAALALGVLAFAATIM